VPTLTNMRYCGKCRALFFDGDANKGLCPADGKGHSAIGYMFVLSYSVPETPNAQANWQQCGKCHVIFFDGYPDKGRCDAGGAHHGNRPHSFVIPHDVDGSQHAQKAWEYCTKCKAIFYDGDADKGHCAAGAGHERSPDAYRFVLTHDTPPSSGGKGEVKID